MNIEEQDTLIDKLAKSLGFEELPNHDWIDRKTNKIYYETRLGLRERGKIYPSIDSQIKQIQC